MDASTNAYRRLQHTAAEPTPAQLHRHEATRRPQREKREKQLVHPLERQRVEMLLAERDMNIAWFR